MTVSKEAIDQYRVRIKALIYDLETSFGVPGAHEECIGLASALIALDRKWMAARSVGLEPAEPLKLVGVLGEKKHV